MTDEEIQTLRAAVQVKLGLACDAAGIAALVRGLPQRHAVELSLSDTADFILRRFACQETETAYLERRRIHPGFPPPGAADKLREDEP